MSTLNIFYGLPCGTEGEADVVLETVLPKGSVARLESRDVLTGGKIYHGTGIDLIRVTEGPDKKIIYFGNLIKMLKKDDNIQRAIRQLHNTMRFHNLADYISDLDFFGFIE
ncbi:MAG: hypothetical protein R3321_02155 [Nitrososphaeraceae archaeon]|nr:hypothetical protein [Nitrososphaeraceae archaeon]